MQLRKVKKMWMYIIQNSYYLAYSLLQNVCLCVYVCISLAIYVLNINQSVVGILRNQSIFRLEKMLRVKTICGWKSPTTELYDSRRQAKIFSYQHSHQIKPFYSRGGDRHIQQRSLLNWVCLENIFMLLQTSLFKYEPTYSLPQQIFKQLSG